MHIPNVSEQSGGGSLIEKGHFILEVSGRQTCVCRSHQGTTVPCKGKFQEDVKRTCTAEGSWRAHHEVPLSINARSSMEQ